VFAVNNAPPDLPRDRSYENIANIEVGTRSRAGKIGLPRELRRFHKALLSAGADRDSLGVGYNGGSRADGVLMFWDPSLFFTPRCILYDHQAAKGRKGHKPTDDSFEQVGFIYPPYICRWISRVRIFLSLQFRNQNCVLKARIIPSLQDTNQALVTIAVHTSPSKHLKEQLCEVRILKPNLFSYFFLFLTCQWPTLTLFFFFKCRV
jgi:hypothetical protein